ncbi:MAG: AfsR/SARP family transcriptional regulator, partial [Gaiellaceae bacterium]
MPAERLLEELWDEPATPTARNALQAAVSRLRKTTLGARLSTRPPGYALAVGAMELDRDRFKVLLEDARRALAAGEPSAAEAALAEGLALWRGIPLSDFVYEPFAQGEISRLEELRLEAAELGFEAELALGRHAEIVADLEQLVAAHPFRERLTGQLMLALYRS